MFGRGKVPVAINPLRARAPALTPLPGSPLSSSPTNAKSKVGTTSSPARSSVRTASSVMDKPAFRSLAPRPQTPPSTTAPEKGLSLSLPAHRSFQPRVCTVSVWPMSNNVSAVLLPLRRPQTFGRPSANSADEASTPRAVSSPFSHPAKLASSPVTLGIEMAFWSSSRAWRASKASLILAIMVEESDISSPARDRARQAPCDRRPLRLLISGLRKHSLEPRLTSGKAWPFGFQRSTGFHNIGRRDGPHRRAFRERPAGRETRHKPPAIAVAGPGRIDDLDRVRWRIDQDAALGVADKRSAFAELCRHMALESQRGLAQPCANVRRPPDPHNLRLARKEGGRAAHKAEIGIEAAVDVFVRKNIHCDDGPVRQLGKRAHILGCSHGRLRRNVKAARSEI